MVLTVFISYSVADRDVLLRVCDVLKAAGCRLLCWNESKEPGEEVWPSIHRWIDECDLVLAIITDSTVKRAMSVGQEIGHAVARGKRVVPLVMKGIPASDLGCLAGIIHQPFDPEHLEPALRSISETMHRQSTLKNEEELNQILDIVLLALGALAAAFFFWKAALTHREDAQPCPPPR